MLIPSDLTGVGTRYYHEFGVPSCALQRQRNSFPKSTFVQGLSSVQQQARSSGFGKGPAGRWEEGNMQRMISRHTALKINQFLLVGRQPGTNSAQSQHGWRSLGFCGSFVFQPVDSPFRSVVGNARVLGSLPGNNGADSPIKGSSSSMPRIRPAIARRSFRESRRLGTWRSRQHRSNSSRIGSTGDFSPKWLLESAVDVLRNFNEKVNSFFQRGGVDSKSRDPATAAKEKGLTSADNSVKEENGDPELGDIAATEKQPRGEFERRSALWEAEVSSLEDMETVSPRDLSSLGADGDISQFSGSNVRESAVGERDVEIRTAEKIEETMPAAVSATPEPLSPENGNVVTTAPTVSPVEESKADSRSGMVSSGTDGQTSQFSFYDVTLGDAHVEIRADDRIEVEALAEEATFADPESGNVLPMVQQESSSESREMKVSSVVSRSDVTSLGTDGEISQLGGSVDPECALSKADVEIRVDETIEEVMRDATTAMRQLEHSENGNMVWTDQVVEGASSVETKVAEVEALGEADVKIRIDEKIEEAMAEAITANREQEHPENGDVISTVQGSDGAPIETKEVDIGELWNRRTSGYSSLIEDAMAEAGAANREQKHPENGDVISTVQGSDGAPVETKELDIGNRSSSGYPSVAGLEPSISRKFRPWDSVEDLKPLALDVDRDGRAIRDDRVKHTDESEPSSLELQARSSPASVEVETVQPSTRGLERESETGSSDTKVQNASANVQAETFEPSAPQTQEGIDAKLYLGEELAEQPASESSLDLEPEPVISFTSVDHVVGESSEGLSLGEDARKIVGHDSTEGGENLSAEGQVVAEESDILLGKRDETENANEGEVVRSGTPVDGLLDHDSKTPVSVGSEEAVESSSFGGQTLAGEAGTIEVKPVSEELGEPLREEDTNDVAVPHEISKLRNSISHHAYLYHALDSPVISDAAYDSLVKELVNLESQVSNSEPLSVLVASEPSPDMLKVVHSVPMLSLTSMQKEEEVLLWYEKLQQKLGLDQNTSGWVVEPKVDGLALSLRYEHGNLKRAATRGNGIQGEDVTHNAQRVLGIPVTIPQTFPGTDCPLAVLEVRGEIFLSLKDFNEMNSSKIEAGEKPMANPRNAAAGSMRLLSSNASELRPLSFLAYSIAVVEESTEDSLEKSSLVPTNQWEVLQLLKSTGFAVNEDNRLFESFDSALEYAKRWRSTRKNLEYEADGVVLKVNDLGTQASLGSTGANPRWALAWKFAATEAVSVLEGIELTIGRSGAMIPNARLKPVELGGVVISRASLHNFGHVKALGLCEGDHVVIQRAGDVIPQVVQVLEDLRPEAAKPWLPPQECPTCGSTLTEVSASSMVFCSNFTCASRHSRQVEHFAKTLISGLGSATLSRLEEELVKNPADFYDLDEQALSKVKRFGKQSVKRLLKAIQESKQQDLWLFIAALGIPKVGTNTAKVLAQKFGSLEALLQSDVSGFKDVLGVGATTASCIFDWCHAEPNIELVHRLKVAGCNVNGNEVIETHKKSESEEDGSINGPSPGLVTESEGEPDVVEPDLGEVSKATVSTGEDDVVDDTKEVIETDESGEALGDMTEKDESGLDGSSLPTTLPLSGKYIVITGDFRTLKREDMRRLVTLHGGVVRKSVTSKTSFVLSGNRPGPLKVAEASRRGVEMLDMQSFLNLIGQTQIDIV